MGRRAERKQREENEGRSEISNKTSHLEFALFRLTTLLLTTEYRTARSIVVL